MIEEFSFGNFLSFKDIQTLNLTAARIKSKNAELDQNNTFKVNNTERLLKVKAIYGANASGKSNLIKALGTFKIIVLNSVKNEKCLNYIDSFKLSTETENKPSFFQIIFRINKIRYRYGFEADNISIKSEWLFSTPNKREQILFIREGNVIIDINKTHFEEGVIYQNIIGISKSQIFTDTSLFLTHLASLGFGKLSNQIVRMISNISVINGLGVPGMHEMAGNALNDLEMKKFILALLNKADTGINDLDSAYVPTEIFTKYKNDQLKNDEFNAKIIVSKKTKYNSDQKFEGSTIFPFSIYESEGTNKMFELSPLIYRSIKEGTPLFIDEFDARFHPLLTKKIVELFNSQENKNAQLVLVTHDTNLLSSDLMRRDQIDFVEKDKYGASHLYTLVEIKGVRNDASFEKDYIQGKYGAIPFLGDFKNLITFE